MRVQFLHGASDCGHSFLITVSHKSPSSVCESRDGVTRARLSLGHLETYPVHIYVPHPPSYLPTLYSIVHHPSARSARIRTTVYVYQLGRAGRYHLDPMKLKFPSKWPRSYARASDVSEIPKADIPPVSLPLSLSSLRCFPLLSHLPRRFSLSVQGRKGGTRETLAPCRNYQLAGINSRAYIDVKL